MGIICVLDRYKIRVDEDSIKLSELVSPHPQH